MKKYFLYTLLVGFGLTIIGCGASSNYNKVTPKKVEANKITSFSVKGEGETQEIADQNADELMDESVVKNCPSKNYKIIRVGSGTKKVYDKSGNIKSTTYIRELYYICK
jgi:hypothetical protein